MRGEPGSARREALEGAVDARDQRPRLQDRVEIGTQIARRGGIRRDESSGAARFHGAPLAHPRGEGVGSLATDGNALVPGLAILT